MHRDAAPAMIPLVLAVIRETDRAWLVFDPEEEDEERATWLPKSTAEQGDRHRIGVGRFAKYDFEVQIWMARKIGWL